jgi:hypothetical protein
MGADQISSIYLRVVPGVTRIDQRASSSPEQAEEKSIAKSLAQVDGFAIDESVDMISRTPWL